MRARTTVGSVAIAALLAACSGGGEATVAPTTGASASEQPLSMVEVAGVQLDVPDGWERRQGQTTGFAAWSWLSPADEDGARVAVQIDVACTGGGDAGAALDGYLDGPRWKEFEVHERAEATVPGATSAERFEATYSLPLASTGQDAPATRAGVLVADDGVAALVLVEGVSYRVVPDLVEGVLSSVRFDAATEERISACRTATGAEGA